MSTYSYFAILGRQPELGLIELESRLGASAVVPIGVAALLQAPVELSTYGGLEKSGRIIDSVSDGVTLSELLLRPIISAKLKDLAGSGKLSFGISIYGRKLDQRELRMMGTKLKHQLREKFNIGARFILPTGPKSQLSAAQIKFNNLITHGAEIVILSSGPTITVGITEQVQDIDWYSRRDFGRPTRSAKVGMLPPKLAQVLVNSTHAPHVVDPFCGTGVVLQEALLLGRSVTGSDLSPVMVAASISNLAWLWTQPEFQPLTLAGSSKTLVTQADARTMELPPVPVSIVSEGYLGPALSVAPSPKQLAAIKAELEELYRAFLINLASQLATGAELALCVPMWRLTTGWVGLNLVDELDQFGYTCKVFKHVPRPVRYSRDDQIVGRALLLMTRN